ncbi:MAG: hypothetical protein INQ03_20745 [Candidatus Heimdallarchaeota archaeon]|nr:hypothetical protein [Candidatus Heimdallarchaeota archaeon]
MAKYDKKVIKEFFDEVSKIPFNRDQILGFLTEDTKQKLINKAIEISNQEGYSTFGIKIDEKIEGNIVLYRLYIPSIGYDEPAEEVDVFPPPPEVRKLMDFIESILGDRLLLNRNSLKTEYKIQHISFEMRLRRKERRFASIIEDKEIQKIFKNVCSNNIKFILDDNLEELLQFTDIIIDKRKDDDSLGKYLWKFLKKHIIQLYIIDEINVNIVKYRTFDQGVKQLMVSSYTIWEIAYKISENNHQYLNSISDCEDEYHFIFNHLRAP